MKKYKLFLIFSLLLSSFFYAQTKDERETRIDFEEFPALALDFLEQLPDNFKRMKYYKESDGIKNSFEAKFKLSRKHYSVEFNSKGILEDIEIIVPWNKLNAASKKSIKAYFRETYTRNSMIKIQKQYKNTTDYNPLELLNLAIQDASYSAIYYEIVAEVKQNGTRTIKEFTFTNEGEYISSRTLKPSSYEHILY